MRGMIHFPNYAGCFLKPELVQMRLQEIETETACDVAEQFQEAVAAPDEPDAG